MEFRQLLPEPGTVDEADLLGSLAEDAVPPPDRPFTIANFVASIDGRATIDGRSGGLGDDGDHAIFHSLREQVDAVLVGTGRSAPSGTGGCWASRSAGSGGSTAVRPPSRFWRP